MDTIPRLDRAEKTSADPPRTKDQGPPNCPSLPHDREARRGALPPEDRSRSSLCPCHGGEDLRYRGRGEEGLLAQRAGNGQIKVEARFRAELWQVLLKVPTDFGWQRPAWTRELLGLELAKPSFPEWPSSPTTK